MSLDSPVEAVREAQRLLGLTQPAEGTAVRVRRLDKGGSDYFLVEVAGHVACLDAETGALMVSAETSRSPLTLTREAAIERSGGGPGARAELAWAPGRASQSMFDPFWVVTENDRTLYVDQRGNVWDSLAVKRPGGGAV